MYPAATPSLFPSRDSDTRSPLTASSPAPPRPPTRRLGWFLQLATTVAESHAAGLLHGQLRAEHLMLGADGDVKVLGFEPPAWRQIRRGAWRGSGTRCAR